MSNDDILKMALPEFLDSYMPGKFPGLVRRWRRSKEDPWETVGKIVAQENPQAYLMRYRGIGKIHSDEIIRAFNDAGLKIPSRRPSGKLLRKIELLRMELKEFLRGNVANVLGNEIIDSAGMDSLIEMVRALDR